MTWPAKAAVIFTWHPSRELQQNTSTINRSGEGGEAQNSDKTRNLQVLELREAAWPKQ